MLKELFESHFYGTFPKITGKNLCLTERVASGSFSLRDDKACRACHYVCDRNFSTREQLKILSQHQVYVISLDDVFSYVKEAVGEISDYMLESKETVAVVEMTCSTDYYSPGKRIKARSQLRNTICNLVTSPFIREHIESMMTRYAVFSWKETYEFNGISDPVEENMRVMNLLADDVYSPDNESKFDFDFKFKEVRYPFELQL